MLELTLHRLPVTTDGIFGRLHYNGELLCHTLEPAWKAIPKGTYRVEYLPESASGKYKDVYWIVDVPGRTGILIHKGNIQSDSTGCILVGDKLGQLGDTRGILHSYLALAKLHDTVKRETFILHIEGAMVC